MDPKYTVTVWTDGEVLPTSTQCNWPGAVRAVAEFVSGGKFETETSRRRVTVVRVGSRSLHVSSNWAAPESMAGVAGNDTHEALAQAVPAQVA